MKALVFRLEPVTEGHHPAVDMWLRLDPGHRRPHSVEALFKVRTRRAKKSDVFRLLGAVDGSPVIAKRAPRRSAEAERFVYEEVLVRLGLPTPRWYGVVEEPGDDWSWIFMEEVEGSAFAPDLKEHRELAARWLATFHTRTERLPLDGPLPANGPARYLDHLGAAQARIERSLRVEALPEGDRGHLRLVVRQLERVRGAWDRVRATLQAGPQTLTHGDFVAKNLKVGLSPSGDQLYVLDWETSGWGSPAPDLASIDLAAYHRHTRRPWPDLSLDDLAHLRHAGRILRLLAAADWASMRLPSRSERPIPAGGSVGNLKVYGMRLATLLERYR